MNKEEAIAALGGTPLLAAQACGISRSAISQWPDTLTAKQSDRVQAALYRKSQQRKRATKRAEAAPTA